MGFSGTIIDVRTTFEYNQDGDDSFINIPLDEVESRIDEFKKMKKPIIFCCRSGARSGMAIDILDDKDAEAILETIEKYVETGDLTSLGDQS